MAAQRRSQRPRRGAGRWSEASRPRPCWSSGPRAWWRPPGVTRAAIRASGSSEPTMDRARRPRTHRWPASRRRRSRSPPPRRMPMRQKQPLRRRRRQRPRPFCVHPGTPRRPCPLMQRPPNAIRPTRSTPPAFADTSGLASAERFLPRAAASEVATQASAYATPGDGLEGSPWAPTPLGRVRGRGITDPGERQPAQGPLLPRRRRTPGRCAQRRPRTASKNGWGRTSRPAASDR